MSEPKRWTDNQTDNRYYKDTDKEPSVTTILKLRDEDSSGLDNWKASNDGEGDNPYHEHLFWYKRNRGTLCHWHALSTLGIELPYSDDERDSRFELFYQNNHNVSDDSPREVLYSVLKDRGSVDNWGDFYTLHPPYKPSEYYRKELWNVADLDVFFFKHTFQDIVRQLDIDVIEVEKYLLDHEYGFGGQVDLVCEYPDGETVIADLKTSSSNRDKNKLQSAAYAKAVENDDGVDVDSIDRTEVWRIHPDTGTFTIHSNEKATPLHSTSYWNESMEDSWSEFEQLCEKFHSVYDVADVSDPTE